eukprot:gene37544-45078_t
MKKLMVLAALMVAPMTAEAADLASKHVAVVTPAADAPFSWTGFYAGIQAGGVFGTTSGPYEYANQTGTTPYSIDVTGGLLGARIGYNYQVNNFVFGIE